jgi:hypothetical protein
MKCKPGAGEITLVFSKIALILSTLAVRLMIFNILISGRTIKHKLDTQ